MKTVLAAAAALAFSAPLAFADCAGNHTASISTPVTVASAQTQSTVEPATDEVTTASIVKQEVAE